MLVSTSPLLLLLIFCVCFCNCVEFGKAATQAWDSYVAEVSTKYASPGIQKDCVPVHYPATSAYKGVVVLVHGFSACPQQWFAMAPLLTQQGYDVLLPLLPGEGLKYSTVNGKVQDDYTQLPMNSSVYGSFSDTMSSIVALAGGEKVVGGLSMGATIAMGASRAVLADGTTGLYSRVLVVCPLIHLANKAADLALNGAFVAPGLAKKVFPFGAECEVERSFGRAGICNMYVGGVAAARNYGKDLLNAKFRTPLNTAVQVVYDLRDDTVDTLSIQSYYRTEASTARSSSMCTVPTEFGHSFLSSYDNPRQFKWWRNEMHCRFAAFLTQSTLDPAGHPADLNTTGFLSASAGICGVECTNNTCSYSTSNPLTCPYHLLEDVKRSENI